MKTPATPLPWKHVGTEYADNGGRFEAIENNQGHCVVAESGPNSSDAAYIVEACNSYPRLMVERAELVAALRQIAKPALGGKQQQYIAQEVLRRIEGAE